MRIVSLVLVSVLTIAATSCGSTQKAACGPVVHDQLDPATGTHVLPGAPTPSFIVDPPTSGAHQPAPPVTGVQHKPIAPTIQVGILEEGRVLLQYKGLDASETKQLEGLVSHHVVVAPAASLPNNAKVVATAWVTHQSCQAFDVSTLKSFISERTGKGPSHS